MNVTLEIFGKSFPIESDADTNYVKKVAEYIDSKFNEISRQTGPRPPFDIAVLVAMNIADELFQGRESVKQVVSILEKELFENR